MKRKTRRHRPHPRKARRRGNPAIGDPTPPASQPAMIEALRHFVNSRELAGAEPLPGRIAITSSSTGEGVSTISRAFAAVLADEFQAPACLVDLSWLGGSSDAAGGGTRAGIRDVVGGSADLWDVLADSGDPDVAILGEGLADSYPHPISPRSEDFDELVDALTVEYDHIVLDLPPVLESSAVLPLFRLADAYLFVIRARVTRRDQVSRSTCQLADLPLLGSVLNRQKSRVPKSLQRLGVD